MLKCYFFLHSLERQVRLSGQMVKVSAEKNQQLILPSVHEKSQLGAWVSQPQSGVVDNRQTMEEKILGTRAAAYSKCALSKFFGAVMRLIIDHAEFWQRSSWAYA